MADSIENWDWRCRAVTTLAAPAGIHKTGTPVYVVTSGRAEGRRITFITPSQEALALSLASRASSTALERRREVQITRVQVAPEPGTRYAIGEESAPALYDFFEACYAVVTFSFQSMEAFANRVIAEKIEPGQTYRLTRGKRSAELDAEELQRRASTDEKVTAVLPELLARPSLRDGRSLWDRYTQLKKERDAIVHLKAEDAYPKYRTVVPSIYHRFLDKGVARHPVTALRVLAHFETGETPRWLTGAAAIMGETV